jgi:hypothetical protein
MPFFPHICLALAIFLFDYTVTSKLRGKLPNYELHNTSFSPNKIRTIKSRRIR